MPNPGQILRVTGAVSGTSELVLDEVAVVVKAPDGTPRPLSGRLKCVPAGRARFARIRPRPRTVRSDCRLEHPSHRIASVLSAALCLVSQAWPRATLTTSCGSSESACA